MKENKEIIVLREKLTSNNSERIELIDKISELELKYNLPKLKNKYEGKYFKYINSYGCKDESWYLYSYCINCIDESVGLFNTFQITSDNIIEIRINEKSYYSCLCQKEITKDEYYTMLDQLKKQINKI